MPNAVFHAPSNDIGRLWAGEKKKKKKLPLMVRHQAFASTGNSSLTEIQLLGRHPETGSRSSPLFQGRISPSLCRNFIFCSYGFFQICILERRNKARQGNVRSHRRFMGWKSGGTLGSRVTWFKDKNPSAGGVASESERRMETLHPPVSRDRTLLARCWCLFYELSV